MCPSSSGRPRCLRWTTSRPSRAAMRKEQTMQWQLSIGKKLIGLGLLAATLTAVVGAVGVRGINTVDVAMDQITLMASAMKNHINADMMHDALRADVLRALNAARDKDRAEETAVRGDIASHAAKFRNYIGANQELALDSTTRAALTEITPSLEAYIRDAE